MKKVARGDAMVAAYQKGESLWDVGVQFGVSYEAVRLALKRRGVSRRRSGRPGGLSDSQLEQAKKLYKTGHSTHSIARKIASNQETVRSGLIFAGITLRAPNHGIRQAWKNKRAGLE